jgi:hypothetical protein
MNNEIEFALYVFILLLPNLCNEIKRKLDNNLTIYKGCKHVDI